MNGSPRRAGPLWLWVLGLIVLVVFLWILLGRTPQATEPAPGEAAPPAQEVGIAGPHAGGSGPGMLQ